MALDPHYNSVVLGLHMDGADNGTTFTDVKGKTVTRVGNTVTKTATKKYGTASAYFDGAGDSLSLADHSDFSFGAGNFTVEGWVYPTTAAGSIAGKWSATVAQASWLFLFSGTLLQFHFRKNDGVTYINTVQAAWTTVQNAWTHLAVTRSGTTFYLFAGGVLLGSVTEASVINSGTAGLLIGNYTSGGFLTGYIDDFRVTKGVARYTANFTPDTLPFCDVLSATHTIAGATTNNLLASALYHAQLSAAGTSLLDAVSNVKEALAQVFGTSDTALVASSTAHTNFAMAGATTIIATHDDRAFSFAGSSSASPVAYGLSAASFSSAGATDLSGLQVWGHVLASYDIAAAGLVAGQGVGYANAVLSGAGEARFSPFISHNKDARFIIFAGSKTAVVSDGKELRQFSINGASRVLFRGPAAECVLRMALPFDRVKPRTLRIKGSSKLVAHTDIPGDQQFTIKGKSTIRFRSPEEKIRCAKLIARQRNKAIFRGAYG